MIDKTIKSTSPDEITRTKVTVRPNHVVPCHSVEIALYTGSPYVAYYNLISPQRALEILAQLEQERETLEAMVKAQQHVSS